jgi:hypothetical protein
MTSPLPVDPGWCAECHAYACGHTVRDWRRAGPAAGAAAA